jgi:hypothetical protein
MDIFTPSLDAGDFMLETKKINIQFSDQKASIQSHIFEKISPLCKQLIHNPHFQTDDHINLPCQFNTFRNLLNILYHQQFYSIYYGGLLIYQGDEVRAFTSYKDENGGVDCSIFFEFFYSVEEWNQLYNLMDYLMLDSILLKFCKYRICSLTEPIWWYNANRNQLLKDLKFINLSPESLDSIRDVFYDKEAIEIIKKFITILKDLIDNNFFYSFRKMEQYITNEVVKQKQNQLLEKYKKDLELCIAFLEKIKMQKIN